MRKNPGGWSAYLRRACAFALIFLLSLQLLPGVSLAADEDSTAWKTLDNRENHASFGKAVTNTYIMEVSSGTRQGGGAADNVLYFVINYTSDDGQHRTAVLAPHEEAISQGFEMAGEQGSRESRRKQVSDVFGYSTAPLESKPGLGSLATDQYMFTTPSAITSIDKIQIFGKRNEQHGNWSCQGMRIYRVDTLYGLEMYGWYSDTGYIDFDGALICKVEMPSGGVTFRWTATARLYNLTADTLNARVTNISEEYKSQLSNRLVFRIDFADVAGAGFETLAGSYTAASKTRISDLKFCETAAIIVRYTDTYGCVREIALPLVINALGQIMEIMGDEYIAEYAQQGDTIAVPAMLPDFANLESVNLVIGEKEATEAAHLITGTMETRNTLNTPTAGGVYTIANKAFPGKVLSLDRGFIIDTNVIIEENKSSSSQHWRLIDAGDGYYYIKAAATENLMLDAHRGSVTNGTNIGIHSADSGTSEKWKLIQEGDDYYAIVSAVDNGQCVDARQSTGTSVQSYKYSKSSSQLWKFTNVSSSGKTKQVVVPNEAMLNNSIRSGRVQKSETDDISYVCFAVYRDVTVQAGLEGATLRTRFTGGTPLKLATATSQDGVPMQSTKTAAILLRNYETNIPLAPKDRTERYLITMSTDNVPNAGTSDDIYLKFSYISVQDKELESSEYRVRDYVQEFYGQWPGSEDDFAYSYGLRDGGTIRFMIPLQNVKEFKTISVRLSGEDEWQFTGIEIAMVKAQDPETREKAYSPRLADWKEIAVTGLNNHPDGLFSHLIYSRIVETEEVCFSLGTVYEDEEERPDPNDSEEEWEPGTLIQDDDTYIFDGETQEVTTKDDVPWDELRHYMTYNDALKDLGFTKERCSYTVTVQVAGKTVNAGNDDCGSKNLFYFRLVFEHGNSGCTLANQQIVGDAFGTGEQVQFKIPTSQDYGEVLEVQVIPDAQDSNSDIYDKLQIEWISVTKDTTSAVSPTWTAKVAAGEDEGWVSINYRDPGEYGGTAKVEGYSLSELATSFPITETSYSTNLLVTITTADYETGVPFTGGMRMDLNFINAEGRTEPKPISGFDVVGAMNEYSGLTGSHTRRYKTDGETVTENADYYVSDSRYQFRPSSTDSFLVTVKNVYQLTDMTLTVYSDEATHWTIKDVSIYQLNGQGIRYLNAAGSYAYRYKIGEEPSLVARWEQDYLTTPLAVYDAKQNGSMAPIGFALNSETIKLSADAAKWSSKITAVPSSHNDTLNLILYPSEGSGAAAPEDYEVTAAVKYTDAMTMQTLQVSAGQLKRGTDSSGRTIFYASGISANNQKSIESVEWSATILRSAQPSIPSGVLQVIRGGVLVESYPLVGAGYSLHPSVGSTAVSTQRLMLQVSEDTKRQTVTAKENDLAVALYFRSDDPSAQEYRSKYVFLSDMGIEEVRPGQLLELEYNLGNVSDIMGINVVSMGKLSANINCAYLADQSSDGTISADRCMRSGFTPTVTPSRYAFEGDAQLLTLAIETAEDESSSTSGTNGPIRMSLGYYDIYGQLLTRNFSDIRPYVVTGQKFASGSRDTVRMLVPDMAELRWIELEPLSVKADGSVDAESMASWKVRQVSAYVGLEERGITRSVDQRVLEGEPLHVGFSDIVLLGTVYVAQDGGDLSEPVTSVSSGRSEAITVDSGADVFITMRLSGSDQSFTAKLDGLDTVTGEVERALLDPTHGYADETLDLIYTQASQSAENAMYEQERANAQRVMDLVESVRNTGGRFYRDQIRLTTPHNYTGAKLKYRITVTSEEAPDAFFTLDVTVSSEPNELAAAIAEWDGMRTAGTVYIRKKAGAPEEKAGVLEGQTLSQLLESGGGVTIVPHVGVGEDDFGATILELDPATNATAAAELGTTCGYPEEELDALLLEARDSVTMRSGTEAERKAAQAVIDAIDAIRSTEGSFALEGGEVRFVSPRNYTGEVLYYRIIVTTALTGDAVFAVDVSVKPESNPLTAAVAAWRGVQTVGAVSILDERGQPADTVWLMMGEAYTRMLEAGGRMRITPNPGGDGAFTAAIRSIDPVTGAPDTADLKAATGYTEDALYELRSEARMAMADRNATDAERRAAEAVVTAVDALRDTDGSFEVSEDGISFTMPHNYTGEVLCYRITAAASQTGDTLFTVDVSVRAEVNPLTAALETWRAVQTVGSVSVLDGRGRPADTVRLAMGETYAQMLGSGQSLVITPNPGGDGAFTATLRSLDPANGATGTADLEVSTGYTTEELYSLRNEARAAMSDYNVTEAELQAARALVTAVDSMRNLDGDFDVSRDEIEFTAPHNFTGGMLYYRITVTASGTGETLFTVDLSVEAETNPLEEALAAWKAVQTAGTVRVLDSDGDTVQTVSLAPGEAHAQQLESGGGLVVQPRSSGSFRADIRSLDPTIGATSVADLDSEHSYSESDLDWMEGLARDALREETDEALLDAADALLDAIAEVQNARGSIRVTEGQIRFTAPRNFTGSTVYYKLTVTSSGSEETLITLNISVSPERDPVSSAFNAFDKALTRAQNEHMSDAGNNDSGTSSDTGSDSNETPADTGNDGGGTTADAGADGAADGGDKGEG